MADEVSAASFAPVSAKPANLRRQTKSLGVVSAGALEAGQMLSLHRLLFITFEQKMHQARSQGIRKGGYILRGSGELPQKKI